MQTDQKVGRNEEFYQELRQIVYQNLSNEQFGVEQLARTYGISRSQLHRKLKKINGKSISQFIREIRLEEALKLLLKDIATVSEIAYQVGFASPTYFNTSFRNYYGYPPGEAMFRHELKEAENIAQITEEDQKLDSHPSKYIRLYLALLVGFALILTGGYFLLPKSLDPETTKTIVVEANRKIPDKSIAILPLKNMTGDPDQEYISDGMTDAVISRLTEIHDIDKVVPFTSTIAYKKLDINASELAKQLNVAFILEGSFQRFGETFKVNVRLVNARNDQLDWSESFEGGWEINDIFDIQTNIAESIADRLQARILEDDYKRLRRNPTPNQEAYNSFLLAEYSMLKLNKESIEFSKTLYEKALVLDPNFIEARIRLALTWMFSGWVWGIHNEQLAWEETKRHLSKAESLKDITNEDRASINDVRESGAYFFEWDFTPAKKRYEDFFSNQVDSSMVDVDSREGPNPLGMAIDFAKHHGEFEDAIIINNAWNNQQTGSEAGINVNEALYRTLLGQYETAASLLAVQDNLFSDNMYYLMESAQTYYYLGEFQSFEKNLSRLIQNFSDRSPRIIFLSAINHDITNEDHKENEYLQLLNDKYEVYAPGSPAWFTALYYAHKEDLEKCLEWLQKSYDRHEVEMVWLRSEPLLKFIHCDPRYFELYKKVGFLVEPPCAISDGIKHEIEKSNE